MDKAKITFVEPAFFCLSLVIFPEILEYIIFKFIILIVLILIASLIISNVFYFFYQQLSMKNQQIHGYLFYGISLMFFVSFLCLGYPFFSFLILCVCYYYKRIPLIKILPRNVQSQISITKAYQILGLKENSSWYEVEKSYRKLIKLNHPDVGGSHYLALEINKARKTLLLHSKSK